MDRSSAYFLVPSVHQWLARLAGRSAHQLTSSFLPLVTGLPSSPDGSLIGLLHHSLHTSVGCPARWTDRSSAYFLISSAHQLLAQRFLGRIARRLTASFLLLVGGSPRSSSDRSLIGLLPSSFCTSVACPARRTDRSSAYFLVPSARQWLAPLARRNTHPLTSSLLPLVSGLSGSPDGSLIGLFPRLFRSSVARRTDRSSAYFLLPSAHQLLARRFLGQIPRQLTSSFLPLVSGSPNGSLNGSLIGLLPRFFRSSVARRTDRLSANLLFSSARQWLAGWIGHRLTSSFLPLISCLPGWPDGALIGLLPHFFRSSVACLARRTDHSLTYFLVPSAHQWLARLAGWITH